MQIEILADADAVARRAAGFVADRARAAIEARGRFTFAVSGGTTPWIMLRHLANEDVDWSAIHLFQVDERVAPAGHDDRNLTHILKSLSGAAAIPPEQIHAMPVEDSDLAARAAAYVKTLESVAGAPAVLDLVHLGLGSDGHTASLVPGDPVLEETAADVAITGVYQGRQRMTLTYPALNRAREILWLAIGEAKAEMMQRLYRADPTIPAGRVRQEGATIFADRPAAAKLSRAGS